MLWRPHFCCFLQSKDVSENKIVRLLDFSRNPADKGYVSGDYQASVASSESNVNPLRPHWIHGGSTVDLTDALNLGKNKIIRQNNAQFSLFKKVFRKGKLNSKLLIRE